MALIQPNIVMIELHGLKHKIIDGCKVFRLDCDGRWVKSVKTIDDVNEQLGLEDQAATSRDRARLRCAEKIKLKMSAIRGSK